MRTVILLVVVMLLCGVGTYLVLDSGLVNMQAIKGTVQGKKFASDSASGHPRAVVQAKEKVIKKKKTPEKKAKKAEEKKQEKVSKKEKLILDPSWSLKPAKPTKEEINLFDLNGPYGDPQECEALLEEKSYKKHKSQKFMVPGKEHWIFRTRQDFEAVYKYRENKAELYRIFTEALRLKGTELVIAYIPPRAVMAEDKIIRDYEFAKDVDISAIRTEFYDLLQEFQKLGVNLVSIPYAPDGDKYFNWADHHWNTQGAKAMVVAVADVVKKTDTWRNLSKTEFKAARKGAVAYDGLYGKVTRAICNFVPYPERDVVYETTKVKESKEGGLFGDDVPPVVLIGTSNSKRGEFNSNFDGFLKEELSLDVYNGALSGGGMDDSIIQYLESSAYRLNQPAFMVWELPSYYNLGGYGMEMALRRAIPAALGSCEDPIHTFGPEPVTGKRLRIISEIEKQKIRTEHTYLEMKFERPIKKDFSISVKTADRKTNLIKFESPHEGRADHFFLLLSGEEDESILYSVGINNSQNYLEGTMVSGKFCALPESIVPKFGDKSDEDEG